MKVVAGTAIFTSVRQALTATLSGLTFLIALTLLAPALLVGVVFSAIAAERRRELGLLLALGARPRQLIRMILVEAALATGLGGMCGVGLGLGLLLLFRRSLGYYFETVGVPILWPAVGTVALIAGACVAAAALVGAVGAAVLAWRTSRREPYDLIRAEGH